MTLSDGYIPWVALYPLPAIALGVFIVVMWRQRERQSTGRPDLSPNEQRVAYVSGAIAVVLLLVIVVM